MLRLGEILCYYDPKKFYANMSTLNCPVMFVIRALPCVLDTEDHPRRQRSHHVIHCPSEISQQYCSMCCISTNNAFTVRVSSCPLSLPRIYCSSNDIFSVPKSNLNFLDKRPHIFQVFFQTPSLINIIICNVIFFFYALLENFGN